MWYAAKHTASSTVGRNTNCHQDVFFPALAGPGRCWGDDGNQVRQSQIVELGRGVNHRIRGGHHEGDNGMPVENGGDEGDRPSFLSMEFPGSLNRW